MKSYQVILLLLAIVPLTTSHGTFNMPRCTHEESKEPPKFTAVTEDMSAAGKDRILQSTEYPKFRIHANFDNMNTAPSAFRSYVQNDLVPPIVSYFESALAIKYPIQGSLSLSEDVGDVCGLDIPNDLLMGVQADYYILYTSHFEDSNVVASSRYCYLSSRTNRPLVGMSDFNRNQIQTANGDVLVHEKNMYLVMHEFMHTLGFSTNTYKFFIDGNGKTLTNHIKTITYDGKQTTVLDLPPLTQRLRDYFGCPTLPGAIMENDGGSGTSASHFERKLFFYETMSSGDIFGRRISQFSLALLEGSGWYVPDYSYAEPYYFGQGSGCGFVYDQCSSSSTRFPLDFCVDNNRGCAPQGRGGGYCQGESNSDNCQFYVPDEDYDCENPDAADNARLPDIQTFGRGAGSKCFTGTLNTRQSTGGSTSFCFKYTCVNNQQGSTELQVRVGADTYTCQQEGEMMVDGYYGYINCPDPATFCNSVGLSYCPRNCMEEEIASITHASVTQDTMVLIAV